jgi:hypothetical protein
MNYTDFLLIEDQSTGEIVSTSCLIPWECSYNGAVMNVAMLEMVLSHPGYRKMGLVRTQISRFMQMVAERKFDFCIISGIPYYYRQYGFAYGIDMEVYESLPVWRVPDYFEYKDAPYSIRQATIDDIAVLDELYLSAMAAQQLSINRSTEHWEYLLKYAKLPVQIIEDRFSSKAVGYMIVNQQADKQRVTVTESYVEKHGAAAFVLQLLKAGTHGEILLGWPENGTLVQLARSLGSVRNQGSQWLINIPDVACFIMNIKPVLEKRLKDSSCNGITVDLMVNLFRQAFLLRFMVGKLISVDSVGFVDSSMGADGGDLCIPPEAFFRLVFGYRSLEELRDAWPDIVVKTGSRYLLSILFPKMKSYLNTTYHYHG